MWDECLRFKQLQIGALIKLTADQSSKKKNELCEKKLLDMF
jgi:hypothetical protein